MKYRSETDSLNEQIILLEAKQSLELKALKDQFHVTYESLKPFNLLKSAFNEVTTSPDLKDNLLNNAIGMTTGYLSKKVMIGSSHNPLKNIVGTLLQFAIGNVVANHSGGLVATGSSMLLKFMKDRKAAKRALQTENN